MKVLTGAAKGIPTIDAFMAAGFPESHRRRLLAAIAFYRREGHLNPRSGHIERGIDLTKWKYRERAAYRRNARTPEQIALLESISMNWEGRRGRPFLSTAQKIEIKRRYEKDKVPIRKIAAEYDRAYTTIHNVLEKLGTRFRPQGGGPRPPRRGRARR